MHKFVFQLEALAGKIKAFQVKGQGLIEYALIILLIAIAVIVTVGLLGDQLRDTFNHISNQIPSP